MFRFLFSLILFSPLGVMSQNTLDGTIFSDAEPLPFVKVSLVEADRYELTDSLGNFRFQGLSTGTYTLLARQLGFRDYHIKVEIPCAKALVIRLETEMQEMDEMVVSGNLKEVSKQESTVNVEVFTPQFFKKNPTPSLFDALQQVNGVRPQLNCNICNTGDIHINGLEGPYTMILIDGMPIVSSLSTVYGLSGIPNALVERIEVIKGPASALYGSEAIGGVINVITRKAKGAPLFSADVHTTSWLETSADLSSRFKLGKKANVLQGISYFNYDLRKDDNRDGFTDVTLQDRISVFQKWNFSRKNNRLFSLAGRYVYEDRWGGEMNWSNAFRGSDSIYGESIYTSRWELISNYQLPIKEEVFASFSINQHTQNSFYGTVPFMAQQLIAFGQVHWNKDWKAHNFLLGTALRAIKYDDNTPATADPDTKSYVAWSYLPGLFVQSEIRLHDKHKTLFGGRIDYHSLHGFIATPRIGYKWDYHRKGILRLNAGTGYRVVNVFTEDHAALTGAREVVMSDHLRPEQSYNVNINLNQSWLTRNGQVIQIDLNAFYTHFNNRIVADYESDPNLIIYDNLKGYAVSQGVSLRLDFLLLRSLKIQAAGTFADIGLYTNGSKQQQLLTEKFSGNWSVSYTLIPWKMRIDYTGSVYSPMRLPLLHENDPRPAYSPWWSLQNIQLTYEGFKRFEIYGGVKNLLNWTPAKSAPFLIARSSDPFDKQVSFDANGQALATSENPHALTFDPSYVYAPNQGIRAFLGLRYMIK